MLPLLGPSSPRDGVGLAVDSFLIDPIGLLGTLGNDGLRPYALTRAVLTGIDKRARIYEEFEELEKTSLDLYASIRSLYRQHRNSEINQGKKPADALGTTFDNLPAMPNIPEIPDEDSPKPQ